MAAEMTLGDFVKQLAALMQRQRISMPFKNQRPWHFLLYELKRASDIPGRPAFLDGLTFDWDGPYPKSQELRDFLHALHWNASVSANNPSYETITLTNDVVELWLGHYEQLEEEAKRFIDGAVKRARAEFSQALDGRKPADAVCSVG